MSNSNFFTLGAQDESETKKEVSIDLGANEQEVFSTAKGRLSEIQEASSREHSEVSA